MEKNTKALLFVGVAAAAVGVIYWKSKQNEKEGNALLEAINKMYAQNDATATGNQAIKETQAIKLRNDQIALGKMLGDIKEPAISKEFDRIYKELWASMKGLGTDTTPFYKAFFQIRNKNTMAYIDKIFKAQFGKGLFETMAGELRLNNQAYGQYSDKTKDDLIIPFYNSHWNPILAKYLAALPVYGHLNK